MHVKLTLYMALFYLQFTSIVLYIYEVKLNDEIFLQRTSYLQLNAVVKVFKVF